MPTNRNIVCNIITNTGVPFAEYGHQYLRGSNTVSCYVESRSHQAFEIRLTPVALPFPDPDRAGSTVAGAAESAAAAASAAATAAAARREEERPAWLRAVLERRARALYQWNAPPRAPSPEKDTRLAWHLLVTIRIDSGRCDEKTCVLPLDREHELFQPPDGAITVRSRLVRDARGEWRESTWIFQEVDGVERALCALRLGGEGEEAAKAADERDSLTAALESMGANDFAERDEKVKAGKIEILLHRVIPGKVFEDENKELSKPLPREEVNETTQSDALDEVTHTMAHKLGAAHRSRVPYIRFDHMDGPDKPYAKFVFMYRSADTLQKFGFPDFVLPKAQPADRAAASIQPQESVAFQLRPKRVIDVAGLVEGGDQAQMPKIGKFSRTGEFSSSRRRSGSGNGIEHNGTEHDNIDHDGTEHEDTEDDSNKHKAAEDDVTQHDGAVYHSNESESVDHGGNEHHGFARVSDGGVQQEGDELDEIG